MKTARATAVSALLKIHRDGGFSNLTLQKSLADGQLSDVDKSLCTALVYGVLDRTDTLDYVLQQYLTKPIGKLSPFVLEVLRITVFQLMFLERIPPHAAVNEAVELVKHSKERYAASLVNAVLRAYLRAPAVLPQDDSAESLHIRFSCPVWIVESLLSDYGKETALAFLQSTLQAPPMLLHTNTVRITPQELCRALQKEGITADETADEKMLAVSGGMDVANSAAYQNGLFFVQDAACVRAIRALGLQKGMSVLDLCAAPGGKSFAAALCMENTGRVDSFDLFEKRAALIASGAERLGLSCVHAAVADSAVFVPARENGYDAVLCDVPCSGLGVLRRKPEIKQHPQADALNLPELQMKILQNAARYVKPGGKLLYSTCTLRKAENEDTVARFLAEHHEFSCGYEHTFFPHQDGTDGFYCACLHKKESL